MSRGGDLLWVFEVKPQREVYILLQKEYLISSPWGSSLHHTTYMLLCNDFPMESSNDLFIHTVALNCKLLLSFCRY